MTTYQRALSWANERGDSGGAMRMRRLLLALYNGDRNRHLHDLTDTLRGMDDDGTSLAFSVMREYAEHGETDELRAVGREIWSGGYFNEQTQAACAAASAAYSAAFRD